MIEKTRDTGEKERWNNKECCQVVSDIWESDN